MHIKFSLLFVLTAGFLLVQQAHGDNKCSIERMKKFALTACHHLLKSRSTREIGNSKSNIIDGWKSYKSFKKHYHIHNEDFPKNGYLKVNKDVKEALLKADAKPPYMVSKKSHIAKKERYRRSDSTSNTYIDYCCLNMCETDFC